MSGIDGNSMGEEPGSKHAADYSIRNSDVNAAQEPRIPSAIQAPMSRPERVNLQTSQTHQNQRNASGLSHPWTTSPSLNADPYVGKGTLSVASPI